MTAELVKAVCCYDFRTIHFLVNIFYIFLRVLCLTKMCVNSKLVTENWKFFCLGCLGPASFLITLQRYLKSHYFWYHTTWLVELNLMLSRVMSSDCAILSYFQISGIETARSLQIYIENFRQLSRRIKFLCEALVVGITHKFFSALIFCKK